MTPERFWSLIAESRRAAAGEREGTFDRQEAILEQLLFALPPDEIVAFDEQFYSLVSAAFDYDLWAVATIVGNGCSDDWFDYFRFWLISLGRDAYERALADPASVDAIFTENASEDFFFETISYAAGKAYRRKTGREIPYPSDSKAPTRRGTIWRDDDELRERFPDLWDKYSLS
jgi:hypothetical protein